MVRYTPLAAACLSVATLVLAGCGGSDGSTPAPPPTQRSTSLGLVLGTDDSTTSGTYAWKGIPYAKPPVGALRWRAPADAQAWTGARSAQQFGNACASSGRLYGPGLNNRYDATIGTSYNSTVGSEDCLYLNVWRPATATEKLPVIVFVHGGSNITGYTADPVYDGATLAKTANAVVVSVNYRLGVLGFLNAAPLKTGDALDDSGNFALLDIHKSLQFIQRNIAQFGGDAGNVTLMGQSAGAVNVLAVMTMPLVVNASPALVHRLIPISGGIARDVDVPPALAAQTGGQNWFVPSLEDQSVWATRAQALLTNLLVSDGTVASTAAATAYIATRSAAQLADYLRSKSADQLLDTVLTKLAPAGQSGANPIPDGTVLPLNPTAEIRAGRYLKVPVLVGNTRDEIKLFPALTFPWLGLARGRVATMTDPVVFARAFSHDPNAAPTMTVADWIPEQFLPTTAPYPGFNATTDYVNQHWFIPNRDSLISALQSQAGQKVWAYRFDWDREPAPFNEVFGAAHAFDLPFIFGNFGPSLYANFVNSNANKPGRLALSDAMMRSIGAFALKGDPNDASLGITWPQWPSTLLFNASLTAKAITLQ
ncbi:carboxylesterase/lipase family protein [Aquabacterium sp. OR-4]|uniref:carboxylesterase/lipase family protein n=1 Tax=Aquabacterium sp. OR-4 TaxID=2978127 RepID=UPI0028C6B526|nr:carboxylesterase family protein [Aquabacterium sp. OR-4]MDT7833753.1 carboxylesterase family protein [Aquabacterium sp. OR-4]